MEVEFWLEKIKQAKSLRYGRQGRLRYKNIRALNRSADIPVCRIAGF